VRGFEIPILKYLGSGCSVQEDFVLICSSCEKVKDDKGHWKNLDGLRKIADMVLSHGLCPRCAEKYSAEIMKLVRAQRTIEPVSPTALNPA